MNTNLTEEQLMKKAKERVQHKIGLIIHVTFWIVISIIIALTVDMNTGLMLFAFLGITVVINFIVYCMTGSDVNKSYNDAIKKEYERMSKSNK